MAAREDPRETVRDARAEDHRAMEIVRVDVSAAREDPQGDGQGPPGRQIPGRRKPSRVRRFGQGRSQGDEPSGRQTTGSNGQGRPDGNRGEGRFGGGQGRQGQRQNTRKNDDMVFAPELTKTSKDSKRERDRENKNKKKDFDKSQGRRTQTKSGWI